MTNDIPFEYVYVDSSGYVAYEIAADERVWLLSEERPPEFWLQRRPMMGKFGGYARRDTLEDFIEIHPPRSYHSDRSHPLPFI